MTPDRLRPRPEENKPSVISAPGFEIRSTPLVQEKAALMNVIHALVDDHHDENPLAKHRLYTGFATVAARYDMRYPLLDELPDDHAVFETRPVEDGSIDIQINAMTLRAAKRLVKQYAQDQQTDPTLPVIDTDAMKQFLDEQIEHHKKNLLALGDSDNYVPRTFTGPELLQTAAEISKLVKEKNLRLLKPLPNKIGLGIHYGSREKFKGNYVNWTQNIVLWPDNEDALPLVYASFDGDIPTYVVDGRGGSFGEIKVGDGIEVHTKALNAKTSYIGYGSTLAASDGHMGSVESYIGNSKFAAQNMQINEVRLHNNTDRVFLGNTEIGMTEIQGALIGENSDIGRMTLQNGKVTLKNGDIVILEKHGSESTVKLDGGECASATAEDHSQAEAVMVFGIEENPPVAEVPADELDYDGLEGDNDWEEADTSYGMEL